ncbi:MAG: signal peptidase I [Deltaproteobacteria bacterium RIFOXYA12_FULL_58_15]|nr:MAG: signal peptidase I [Deltaproteobacteria bacterium RIFOXYA12_FULL_58_15]OGR09922.1 MAG: signal peptidase I [Deltaproteobacteria bacterium RIFOXYB12_FULL_58_9]
MDPNMTQSSGGGAAAIIFGIIYLGVIVLMIAAMWKIFVKAGQPGWAAIVPIYNLVILLQITGKPIWWIVLFLIPLANLVIAILLYVALAQSFGKGVGFAVGMLLLPFVFFPMLGFGSAQYKGAAA